MIKCHFRLPTRTDVHGEELLCETKPGNRVDCFAVASCINARVNVCESSKVRVLKFRGSYFRVLGLRLAKFAKIWTSGNFPLCGTTRNLYHVHQLLCFGSEDGGDYSTERNGMRTKRNWILAIANFTSHIIIMYYYYYYCVLCLTHRTERCSIFSYNNNYIVHARTCCIIALVIFCMQFLIFTEILKLLIFTEIENCLHKPLKCT